MESSGPGISRLDCYEDMFKEITRKLYGEDPDHRTSSVQNEFETSVSYKNEEDAENGTDGSDDGNWTCEDEPLKGTDGSRVAAYHAGKTTWRCYECGECMGGGPRDVAEHFVELHSSRILAEDSRNRHHSPVTKDYLQIEEVVSYLERVRDLAERSAPPSRRTQETQTIPAALLPVTSTFLLQELPSVPAPQTTHLTQSSAAMPTSAAAASSGKRYTCPYCPYGTDRRDLYTRHENIHREEKPFHCYVCYKPFNRADHVKKHFLRMHREHRYELSRIRRPAGSGGSTKSAIQQDSISGNVGGNHANYSSSYNNNKGYQLQPTPGSGGGLYQATTMPAPGIMQPEAAACGRRMQNGGCNSKSHLKGGSKGTQERRYTCCYCSWSGVDNWCLKRHLNTHLKPFACALCEYKAARAERLATHVLKVHNRRQCSRCSFLGEDAAQLQVHQLHVHRVGSANAPAPSTQSNAQPNSRHQQQLQTNSPVGGGGGGRPPPGPPVFPASTPAIAPATTVIPPTTILGHEMVNSPATAGSMASPQEESREDEDKHDQRGRWFDDGLVARSSARVSQTSKRHGGVCGKGESPNHNFKRSRCRRREAISKVSDRTRSRLPSRVNRSGRTRIEMTMGTMQPQLSASEKRSRKQSQPRKVIVQEEAGEGDEDLDEKTARRNESSRTKSAGHRKQKKDSNKGSRKLRELRDRYLAQLVSRRGLFKCQRCPREASANGFLWVPYHTRASLTLHTLWRHGKHCVIEKSNHSENHYRTSSAVTLKATVYTSPTCCTYQR